MWYHRKSIYMMLRQQYGNTWQYIQRYIERPFQDRVSDVIQEEYATAVKRFERPGFVKHSWLFTEVYIKTYTHYAFESYQRETV